MEQDIRVNYDALCYAAFINIKTLTSGAKRIAFKNFDYKNDEHKFVLSVTTACWNLLGERNVAIDSGFIVRKKLGWKYRKLCKIEKTEKNEEIVVDIEELLEFMRGPACQMCGLNFSFADIYNEYYNERNNKI